MPSKRSNKGKGKGSNSHRQKQKTARRAERESILSDAASNQQSVSEAIPDTQLPSPDLAIKPSEPFNCCEDASEQPQCSEGSDQITMAPTEDTSMSAEEVASTSPKLAPREESGPKEDEASASESCGSEELSLLDSNNVEFALPEPILPIESEVVGKSAFLEEGGRKNVVIEIDDDADFVAMVTEDRYSFSYLVSRHVLIRSSTIIKSLVSSMPNDAHTVNLIGDSNAMNIVLRIIHFHSMDDVFNLTLEEVKKVAILCDRYKWHNVLRPFTRAWLQKYARKALEPGFEDWLFVAKVFECDLWVEDLLLVLAEQCGKPSPRGGFIHRKGVAVPTALWPRHHLAKILARRQEKLDYLVELLNQFKEFVKFSTGPSGTTCESEVCLNLANGSFNRSVRQCGMGQLIEGTGEWEWEGSVQELREEICDLQFQTLSWVLPGHICWLQSIWENFVTRICGVTTEEEEEEEEE
ncbi:hypothetical protein TWF102_009429 [Orbilia oligospora]|uniref:BTB domain-containing protein n=1 Tax=Orbilia oligospora TaxID=2813651 RepID=A0A7C8NTT2_ORBOL|nr:hypothetical protein TWF102_009429 [Orbilia oligospora]KAF3094349.1 hypothetical protein TWF103_010547 [Orbilia oligospora]KAF3117120.1 hypothetical protein TWF706_000319 [Orbilia oligospora]KAF3136674.1 hypothetical protein TWF703_005388 [Orbilia oligospora]KAF3141816.1 hypothetical protein TWF594_005874 [Orbilia oligospora]